MNTDESDELINEYIQKNLNLIEWDQLKSSIQTHSSDEKRTWIVTENGNPIGIIPFNRVEEVSQLEKIQVYEVSYPLDYTFTKGQKRVNRNSKNTGMSLPGFWPLEEKFFLPLMC